MKKRQLSVRMHWLVPVLAVVVFLCLIFLFFALYIHNSIRESEEKAHERSAADLREAMDDTWEMILNQCFSLIKGASAAAPEKAETFAELEGSDAYGLYMDIRNALNFNPLLKDIMIYYPLSDYVVGGFGVKTARGYWAASRATDVQVEPGEERPPKGSSTPEDIQPMKVDYEVWSSMLYTSRETGWFVLQDEETVHLLYRITMGERVLVVRIDPLPVQERLGWIRGTSDDTLVSVMADTGAGPEADGSGLAGFASDGETDAVIPVGDPQGDWITTLERSSVPCLWYLSAVRKTDAYRLSNLSVRVAAVLLALAVTVSVLLTVWNIRRNIAPLEQIAAKLSRGSERKSNEIQVINEAIEDLLGELDTLNSRLAEQQAPGTETSESGAAGPEEEGARHEIAEKVWQIIETQYTKPELDLNAVAEQAGYSPRYISMLFKQEYGSGVAEYISLIRIQKAKELIAESDMSIKAVAAEVGFAGDVQFIRAFKRLTGITPGSYRSSLYS